MITIFKNWDLYIVTVFFFILVSFLSVVDCFYNYVNEECRLISVEVMGNKDSKVLHLMFGFYNFSANLEVFFH